MYQKKIYRLFSIKVLLEKEEQLRRKQRMGLLRQKMANDLAIEVVVKSEAGNEFDINIKISNKQR